MAKKYANFLTLGVLIIMSLGLAGCGANIPYNAVMYGDVYKNRTWLNDEFYESNLTYGSWSNNIDDYVNDESLPQIRVLIIKEQEIFDYVFTEFPAVVNFEKDMVLMYGITTASGSELILSNVLLDGEKLTVKYAYPVSDGPHPPDGSMPMTKWVIVTMDKLDIETAEFIFGN